MGTNNYLLIEIGGAKHRAGPMIGSLDRQLYQQYRLCRGTGRIGVFLIHLSTLRAAGSQKNQSISLFPGNRGSRADVRNRGRHFSSLRTVRIIAAERKNG